MKNQKDLMTEYPLSGDGVVRVYQPFGKEKYTALVEQNGRYPAAGKVARNSGRSEFSLVVEGCFEYSVDGTKLTLGVNDYVTVADGQRYSIEGSGRILVFVSDQTGGTTLIEDIS